MCLDKQCQEWAAALIDKRQPRLTGVGIAYMLRGDKGASNTDPYASGPTGNNQWVKTGPHIMVLRPDPKQLEGIWSVGTPTTLRKHASSSRSTKL